MCPAIVPPLPVPTFANPSAQWMNTKTPSLAMLAMGGGGASAFLMCIGPELLDGPSGAGMDAWARHIGWCVKPGSWHAELPIGDRSPSSKFRACTRNRSTCSCTVCVGEPPAPAPTLAPAPASPASPPLARAPPSVSGSSTSRLTTRRMWVTEPRCIANAVSAVSSFPSSATDSSAVVPSLGASSSHSASAAPATAAALGASSEATVSVLCCRCRRCKRFSSCGDTAESPMSAPILCVTLSAISDSKSSNAVKHWDASYCQAHDEGAA